VDAFGLTATRSMQYEMFKTNLPPLYTASNFHECY
jgi:hypothetical protein